MPSLITTLRNLQLQAQARELELLCQKTDLQLADVDLDPDTKNRYFRSGHERNLLATMLEQHAIELSKVALPDSFNLLDPNSLAFNKDAGTDVFVMNESLSRTVDYQRSFTDAFTLDDNATVDAITKDFFGAKTNIFGFADTQALGVGKNLTDTFSPVEAIDSLDIGKGLTDTQSMTEVLSRTVQYSRSFTDTFVMDDSATVDAIRKDTNAGKTNIYTMGDVFNRQVDYVRSFTDTFSPIEAHAVELGKTADPDSFNMSESLSRVVQFSRSFADSFSPTESIDSFVLGKGLTDSQPMTEAHSSSIGLGKTDSTTLTDSPTQSVDLAKTDSFSFNDIDSRVVQFVRTFSDAFTLDDAATVDAFSKEYGGNKTNVFGFSDTQTFGVGKGLTDSFSFADDPDVDVGKGLTDSVTVTENFSFALFSNAAFNAAPLNASPFNE